MTRRDLLKALGGGLLVAVSAPQAVAAPVQGGGRGSDRQSASGVSAWLHIGPDGRVRVFSGKVEVGQNVRTSLAQAVAEELRVPMESIEMVLGDTDQCPFDQGTFGSRSTPTMSPQLRQAAATAREALIALAAKELEVDPSRLSAQEGKVMVIGSGSGSNSERALSYAELAKKMSADLPVRRDAALTPPSEWKVMGQSASKVNGRDIVTGAHRYSIDLRRPGVLHAKILRPPSLGAELVSVDVSGVSSIPEAKVVREGDFVGVAAPSVRLAERALSAIKAEWNEKPQPSNKDLWDILRGASEEWIAEDEAPSNLDPWTVQEPGDWAFMATASKTHATINLIPDIVRDPVTDSATLETVYRCPYIAHVPLEPRSALAEFDGSKLTVYTGTQRPFGVRGEVMQATGLPESQVRVIVPDTGSGYGGKHSGDAAVEAARMAKALKTSLHLAWTRAEEFMFAYFRPAGVIDLQASANGAGKLTTWSHVNFNSGGAGIRCPYDVPNPEIQNRNANTPLRQGSYRTLAATFNNFARETAIDELAHAVGIDPLKFRLDNLSDPRLVAVLRAVADRIDYEKTRPEGVTVAVACGTEKGGFVANAVELSVETSTGHIRLIRIVTAFECGKIVNPDHCENQVLGSVLQGLGGALFERIEFANGKILNGALAKYRVPRFSDIPPVETILLDRPDLPSAGAGEAAIVAIAPAIGNAVYKATKVRLRDLPLQLPTPPASNPIRG